MTHLMRYKIWFFVASTLIIIPGLIFILLGGLKFGIDFTGGALLEYKFENPVDKEKLAQFGQVIPSGENTYMLRTGIKTHEQLQELKTTISNQFGNYEVRREENVGPVIGKEL